MIEKIRTRFGKAGLYPLVAGGAALVIIVFGLVAFLGSQRTTPNTGNDAGQVAISTATPSATPSSTPSGTSLATAAAQPRASPSVAGNPKPGAVLTDESAQAPKPTWQSPAFTAPNTWTISYTYDCGGYGGHFTVAVFSDVVQYSPIVKHGDKGSGTVTIKGGGTGYYIATDTTDQCSWHVTARG